ncbi:MAG: AAA family ATPase [Aliihoeflea sp.]|uniref:AAA family ATPase n=1 Tax=Aliihoeflea sp. TaxID=2608088 RepID=UPI004037B7FA
MRLRRLDLTRYGKFTDYSIDFGEHDAGTPDLHIVYGLNEAGKSTSLSAYLDLLFGIEERTRYGFLHQGKAMEIGACLEFDGQAHEFKRVKQRSNSLLDAHGQPVNEAILSVPLAGLTRDAYRMMFSLDDQTLEDGGNAILESKGDLGELLFSASAGLAGISSILEAAIAEADGIFRKRASSTKIAGLKRQIADLKSQRDDIDIQASAYRTLTTALEQAEAAYDAVMKEIGTAKARHDEIERVLRAHPLAADYRRADEQLSDCADLPHPPAEWASALPDLIVEETRLQTELTGIKQREQKVREELEGLVVENSLLEMTDQLDQLSDAAARYATAQEDLPKRKQALSESNRKVDLILATLGQTNVGDPKSLLIPAATIGALRDLISARSGVDVARHSAEKEFEAARQAFEKEQRDRLALDGHGASIDAGKIAQLQSVLRRMRDSNLVAEVRLAERAVPAKRQAFDDAKTELHPWAGDGDALRRILPPATDRVESWKSTHSELEKRRSQTVERERELSTKQEEDAARLAALRDAIDIMDDEEAKAALRERDEAWAQHRSVLDRETADRFETRMRTTDAAAAARLNNARQLEELRSLTAGMAVDRASVDRQRQLLRGLDDELQTLRGEIRTETPVEIDLDADTSVASWLTRIGRWVEVRALALTAWDDLRLALRDAEDAKTTLAREQDTLATTLIGVGIDVEHLNVAALVQAADTILVDHAAMQTRLQDSLKRVGELEAAAVRRKAELDEAVTVSNAWQTDWSTALESTWFEGEGKVGAIRELLDALAGLPEALREKDDLLHRIDSMEADRKSFVEAVAQLHDAFAETFDDSAPLAAARALLRRREEARQVEGKRQERDQSLVDLATERERLDGEIAIHAAGKTELTDFFQTGTLADVRQALERCRKRDELVEQQSKLERQIVGDMQLPSLDSAMASLANTDLAELQREQAELVTRLDDLDARSKNLFADKARATDRLTAIGGDDSVARLEANRRTLLLEIEDLALRYLRLRSGSLIAEHGIRAYRDRHRSAMMNRASEAFRLITRDEYTGLATRPNKDREALIGLSRHGGSKLAIEMSKGTQFQLYLALRLAGYEEFATARPSVPFIADDIMETFDEPRSEEVFRLFGQMAQVGQVVYLTHHRHICEIAATVVPTVKIHEIV